MTYVTSTMYLLWRCLSEGLKLEISVLLQVLKMESVVHPSHLFPSYKHNLHKLIARFIY